MSTLSTFSTSAQHIRSLPIQYRANNLDGCGHHCEVIFDQHPVNCPSSFTMSDGNTTTSPTNDSTKFEIKYSAGINGTQVNELVIRDVSQYHEIDIRNVYIYESPS